MSDKNIKYVRFHNIKKRGNVSMNEDYCYRTDPDINYRDLLGSVRRVTRDEIHSINVENQISIDKPIVETITTCLNEGINQKMDLAKTVAKKSNVSIRIAIETLERYTGNNPSIHKWTFNVGARGAKVYQLIN